jgi:hypothetical protein
MRRCEPSSETKHLFLVVCLQGFDQLCLSHCGEIDGMLEEASRGHRKSIELAQKVVRQQLAAVTPPTQTAPKIAPHVQHGSNSLWRALAAAKTAATDPSRQAVNAAVASAQKLSSAPNAGSKFTDSPNFNVDGYWPAVGDTRERKMMKLLHEDEDPLSKHTNFNKKGYWPINGNDSKFKGLGLLFVLYTTILFVLCTYVLDTGYTICYVLYAICYTL